MIRKVSSDGVGYSVVDLNQVKHVFASAVPRAGGTFLDQSHDALQTIESVIRDETAFGTIVRQAVFIRDINQREECRKIIEDFYGEALPATSYIVQPPCGGKDVEIEAWGVGRVGEGVEIHRYSDNLVVVKHDEIAWAHCARVVPQTDGTKVYDRSLNAFERMRSILASQGFRYEQVIRTWLYLGDIVGPEGDTQRYKELNRARTDFYEKILFLRDHVPSSFKGVVYPASTGIGTEGADVLMGSVALATDREDVTLLPMENPQQTAAFDYETTYSPKSPKFCRAMAVVVGGCATVLISGTASIVNSETKFIGDVEGQTNQTLDNIEALISAGNFQRYGMPGLGATLKDLALARVYIKNKGDYEKTRAICEKRLGELPTIYAVADVCRPELLVEIEGVAIAKK
ncbi:MAG: hypothetical protein GXP25_07555 [Planctomycetes bacterium]|nr:hypothetical protein [Planctomycetota bacterium]